MRKRPSLAYPALARLDELQQVLHFWRCDALCHQIWRTRWPIVRACERPLFVGHCPTMITIKADDRRRVMLPGAKPRQKFRFLELENGTITLTPVKPVKPHKEEDALEKPRPAPKFKLTKQDGFTVIETDRQVSQKTINELLSELP
jgi:hypothetical protein